MIKKRENTPIDLTIWFSTTLAILIHCQWLASPAFARRLWLIFAKCVLIANCCRCKCMGVCVCAVCTYIILHRCHNHNLIIAMNMIGGSWLMALMYAFAPFEAHRWWWTFCKMHSLQDKLVSVQTHTHTHTHVILQSWRIFASGSRNLRAPKSFQTAPYLRAISRINCAHFHCLPKLY